MAIATVAATVGSAVIGGVAQSHAANTAASAQRNAASQANATEQGFFNTTQEALNPFINTGANAANKVSQLEGLGGGGPNGIQATLEGLPGYQFANTQGLKSVQNSATARGLGVSGAAQKGAANYSTGLANSQYNNLLTGVQGTANMGEQAGAALGGVAQNFANSMGQNIIGAGNATAASNIAGGTAIANAANSIPNSLIASSLLQGVGAGNPGQTNQYSNTTQPTVTASPYIDPNNMGVGSGLSNQFQLQ